MGLTLASLNGYEKGRRYEKELQFVSMFGNARERSLVLKDEEGNELLWTTSDTTQAYKNFRTKGTYKFTVSYIMNVENMTNPPINIGRLTLINR